MSKTDFVGSVSKTPKSCQALSILFLEAFTLAGVAVFIGIVVYAGVAPILKSVSILAIKGFAEALKNISWKLYSYSGGFW